MSWIGNELPEGFIEEMNVQKKSYCQCETHNSREDWVCVGFWDEMISFADLYALHYLRP